MCQIRFSLFKKAYILLLFVSLSSCSLIYDQSQNDNMSKSDVKNSGISLDVYQQNKHYESNRILSSDFPVTYKAKPLKTF